MPLAPPLWLSLTLHAVLHAAQHSAAQHTERRAAQHRAAHPRGPCQSARPRPQTPQCARRGRRTRSRGASTQTRCARAARRRCPCSRSSPPRRPPRSPRRRSPSAPPPGQSGARLHSMHGRRPPKAQRSLTSGVSEKPEVKSLAFIPSPYYAARHAWAHGAMSTPQSSWGARVRLLVPQPS